MSRDRMNVTRAYECDWSDLFVAANAVIAKLYGADAIRGPQRKFFGIPLPWRGALNYQTVEVGYKERANVVGGFLDVRGFPGKIWLNAENNSVTANVRKDHSREANFLLQAVQEHLDAHSIYRGKAFNVLGEFLDLSKLDEDTLIYNADLERELDGHVWTLMEEREECRRVGRKVQRKVVFAGQHGSGKSITALLTAKRAVSAGWTFVFVGPEMATPKAAVMALDTARKYTPAIVLLDEFDRDMDGDRYAMSRLLGTIEGMLQKSGELIVIMTTNYPEKLGGGLQRPGRIDVIIDFDRFDAGDVRRLLQRAVPAQYLDPSIDWDEVGTACKGFSPSFVSGVGESATLMAISEGRRNSTDPRVSLPLLVEAATKLRGQHDACTRKPMGIDTGRA